MAVVGAARYLHGTAQDRIPLVDGRAGGPRIGGDRVKGVDTYHTSSDTS